MATDLAKLVVRLEAENSKLSEGLNKATRDINKFKGDVDSAMSGVKSAFGSFATLALSAVSITAVTVAIKDMVNAADDMSKLSQKVGVATETLSGLAYAAKLADLSQEGLANGLKRLSANAADAARGTGEAQDAFKALGIDVRDASGNLKTADAIMLEVADAFAAAEDGVGKTSIAMKLFGKAGADMIPFLNGGADGIMRLTDEAKAFGVTVTAEAGVAAEEFNDNLTRLGTAADGLAWSIAQDLLPGMVDITDAMAAAAKEGGLLKAAWVALGGLGALLFTDEFDSDLEKLSTLKQRLGDLQRQLKSKDNNGALHDWVFGDELDINEEIDSVVAEMSRLQDRIKGATSAADEQGTTAGKTKTKLKELATETKGLSDAQKTAQKELVAYEARLAQLVASLDPAGAGTDKFMQSVADLDRAWVEGRISGERYDELMLDLATDTDAVTKATEEQAKAVEKAAEEAQKAADKAQELAMEPFKNAFEGMQGAFTDMLANIFDGGVDTFDQLANQIKSTFARLAAEIASMLVFQPIVNSVAGNITGTAGGASGSAGGFNPIGMATQFLGPAGSVLGLGAGVGMAGQAMWGGNTYGNLAGGMAGTYGGVLLGSGAMGGVTGAMTTAMTSAMGATIGQLGNFIIPVLGGLIGAWIGSKIGGGGPSNQSAWGSVNTSTGATSSFGNMTGAKFSQQTVDARDQFFSAISQFSVALTEITGGKLKGSVSADIGLRDGTQVFGSLMGSQTFANPQLALEAIFDTMIDKVTGVGAEWRSVLSRLDTSNMEQAVQDLSDAAFIINKEYIQAEPLSAAKQALDSINASFAPIIARARELGIAVAPIIAERTAQRVELRNDFNDSIDAMILAFTDPLAAALDEFDALAEDRLQNAKDLGADLLAVEELNALERAQVIEQFTNSVLDTTNKGIEDFLTGLRSGTGSYLSPETVLANAEEEFAALSAAAQDGDEAARADLTGAAANLIAASEEMFGSTAMFFERLGFIDATLSNLIGETTTTTTLDTIGSTIASGNAALEYQLEVLNSQITYLTAVIVDQQSSLDRLNAA